MLDETLFCRDSLHLKYKILHFKYFMSSKNFLQLMDLFKEKPQRQAERTYFVKEAWAVLCIPKRAVSQTFGSITVFVSHLSWICLPFITVRSSVMWVIGPFGKSCVWPVCGMCSSWCAKKPQTGQFNQIPSHYGHFQDTSASPGLLTCQTVFTTGVCFPVLSAF